MNTDLYKVVNHLVKMSASGGLTCTYENKIVSLNFKITDSLVLKETDDMCCLQYYTETNASPGEIRFKLSEVKEAKFFAEGEFDPCPYCQVVQIFFNDGSQLDCFEDYR